MRNGKNGLTAKQKAFINHYIQIWNAAEAARRAGYQGNSNTLAVVGHENLSKPNIWTEIERRMQENAMEADEVLSRLTDQARTDMGDFMDVRHNYANLDLEKAKALGLLRHIKRFETKPGGGIKIELYSSQAALQTLAKAHGLLKTEINVNINLEVVNRVWTALEEAGKNPEVVLNQLAEKAERVH